MSLIAKGTALQIAKLPVSQITNTAVVQIASGANRLNHATAQFVSRPNSQIDNWKQVNNALFINLATPPHGPT